MSMEAGSAGEQPAERQIQPTDAYKRKTTKGTELVFRALCLSLCRFCGAQKIVLCSPPLGVGAGT